MKVICFDIGGTGIKHAIIENEKILNKGSFPTCNEFGFEGIKKQMIQVTSDYIASFGKVDGVGISSAGSIDYESGVVIVPPPTLLDFKGWNLAKMFEDNFGLKIVADNDVNSFAAAECGLNKDVDMTNVVVLTLGTGIGGGIIVNGKIIRGKQFNAGEVGRMNVNGNDWEYNGSTIALVRKAKEAGLRVNSGIDVFDLYDSGDETAIKVVNEWYDYIAIGLSNIIYILNPDTFIIGGGVSARSDLCQKIEEHTNKILKDGFENTFKVIPAKFKNDGGVLGAYCNFIDRYGK